MGRMLVNNIQLILKLYQPVGIKYLSDDPLIGPGSLIQEPVFKQVQLLSFRVFPVHRTFLNSFFVRLLHRS